MRTHLSWLRSTCERKKLSAPCLMIWKQVSRLSNIWTTWPSESRWYTFLILESNTAHPDLHLSLSCWPVWDVDQNSLATMPDGLEQHLLWACWSLRTSTQGATPEMWRVETIKYGHSVWYQMPRRWESSGLWMAVRKLEVKMIMDDLVILRVAIISLID